MEKATVGKITEAVVVESLISNCRYSQDSFSRRGIMVLDDTQQNGKRKKRVRQPTAHKSLIDHQLREHIEQEKQRILIHILNADISNWK